MLEKINEEIKELAENASKSVVAILTREIALDEFLSPAVREGIGSGFSVLENHFLTSYHVIRNSREILLIDKEGNIESAQVVATNPFYDLALLKSDLSIPPLKISTSYSLGEMVFAIGNPLGLRSITLGVISGTGRTIVSPSGEALYVLQTDAAVNPGNSGGPLVNIKGEAIGIVTAMIPFAQGIGFAIPAELMQGLLNSYIRFGRYIRPFLGLVVMAINKAIAAYYGLSRSEGLLVVRVSPRSPAKLAIMQGDIIIEADGRKVNNPIELQVALESKGFGNEIELLVDRMGKTFKVRTKIAGYEI
jgi:S1-C subfamily serine protease